MHRFFLGLIIAVYVVLGLLYAVNTPLWQAPDEPAHFNYIHTIGDTGTLPILMPGDYDQDYLERIKAAHFPASMSINSIRYESYQPPLYYLAATPVYRMMRPMGLEAEVLGLRLFSVLLEVIVLLLAFTIVRELFGGARLALATVGLMATIPMHIAITASISNDTAAELVLAAILLISLRRVSRMISDRNFILWGGILFAAALLTKTTTYLPGAVLLAGGELGARWMDRIRHSGQIQEANRPSRVSIDSLRNGLPNVVGMFVIGLVISSPMFIRNLHTYGLTDPLGLGRHNSIVIGQPTTVQFINRDGLGGVISNFTAISFQSFWAQFGWMGVPVNSRIYAALFVLSAFAALGLLLYVIKVVRVRELLTAEQRIAMILLALMLGAGIVAYLLYNLEFFQAQGRYLFPVIIPIALFMVIGWRELLVRLHVEAVIVVLYGSMVALDLACLFLFIVPQLRVG